MNEAFIKIWLNDIPYKSKQDLYENLYLKAIVDSYQVIDKSPESENKIRDRFVWDMNNRNPLTKKWFDMDILEISSEKELMITQTEKRRVDISFFWSGFGRFEVECKLLFQQPSKNKAYIKEGLSRFISMKYAEKNSIAAMLGFIISGDIEELQGTIANECSDFHPDNAIQKKENPDCFDWKFAFTSHHITYNAQKIHIHHLFFEFKAA